MWCRVALLYTGIGCGLPHMLVLTDYPWNALLSICVHRLVSIVVLLPCMFRNFSMFHIASFTTHARKSLSIVIFFVYTEYANTNVSHRQSQRRIKRSMPSNGNRVCVSGPLTRIKSSSKIKLQTEMKNSQA